MRKVLVVSDSPALRETVEIVLGDQFAVESLPAASAPTRLAVDVALLIVDAEAPVPAGDAPVISIGDTRFRALPAGRRRQYLPAVFDALALREAAGMLARTPQVSEPAAATQSFLSPPFLPASLATLATSALHSQLPACIWGEAGTGKLRLARALHAGRQAAYLMVVTAAQLNRDEPSLPEGVAAEGEVTLIFQGLEGLDAAGQSRLLEMLEGRQLRNSKGEATPLRVVSISRLDPALLARDGRIDRSLFYQLGVFTLPLPPLRQRTEDIPALVHAVAGGLCDSLGLPPVTFTQASLARLSRYLWFGNLAELEAVLARSIVLAGRQQIDIGDLRFGYGTPVGSARPLPSRPEPAAVGQPSASEDGDAVDLIIQELAHEFKNPMVTIKTFAHQLDHMLSNGGGHEEFARLTGEAVERMDAALENLVQYTRFQEPSRQPTSLGSIVSTALGGVQEEVGEKHLALEIEPMSTQVWVDPAQCGYAVKNLLRTIVRDLSSGDALRLRAPATAALAIEYPARARRAASSLARLVSGDDDGKDALPLGFAFAKSLIERNGGQLVLDREDDVARVTVEFPRVGEGKGEHGEAESPGR